MGIQISIDMAELAAKNLILRRVAGQSFACNQCPTCRGGESDLCTDRWADNDTVLIGDAHGRLGMRVFLDGSRAVCDAKTGGLNRGEILGIVERNGLAFSEG
jgi:hypothetical protein